jgi:dihydrofolate reductase
MKVTLVMVMSADGKITAGENSRVHNWTSTEDQKYFSSLIKKSRLVIMGRKTFLAAKSSMKLNGKTLRIVMTRNPEQHSEQTVPGQLEFTNDSPEKLLAALKKRGYKEALLVGGAEINSTFLKANLIDELWLTLEPVILGNGKSIFSESNSPTKLKLKLKSSKKFNTKGTLLLKYDVVR